MNFRWQDVDPDIHPFAIVGIPLIAIGLYLKSCGFFGPEPVPDWSHPVEPIEEWRADQLRPMLRALGCKRSKPILHKPFPYCPDGSLRTI